MPFEINPAAHPGILSKEISRQEILADIEKSFALSLLEMKRIMRDFHTEMKKGLSKRKSSLKMIPAYVDKATGNEKGRFISLDLGGTNFRILQSELKGRGRIAVLSEKKFTLEKRYTDSSARELFDFIAGRLKDFSKEEGLDLDKKWSLGFTFSFPVRQTGIASGILVHWTKDFSAKGVVGKDVVRLLKDALSRRGMRNIRIAALVNDTVGTLVARSYNDPNCDVAVILGTGTNACYRERISEIVKWKKPANKSGKMVVNIEWGNFNKLNQNIYDRIIDKDSDNPGCQKLEKMVSGMYLGEISRLILGYLIKRKMLFGGEGSAVFELPKSFKTEYMSRVEEDRTDYLSDTRSLLKGIGITDSSLKDRLLVQRICGIVAKRGACISALALAAVIKKIDPGLTGKHTVAIDGAVYEKHPAYAKNIESTLKRIFGKKSGKIKLRLTKDGSGIGAAIIASLAAPDNNRS